MYDLRRTTYLDHFINVFVQLSITCNNLKLARPTSVTISVSCHVRNS